MNCIQSGRPPPIGRRGEPIALPPRLRGGPGWGFPRHDRASVSPPGLASLGHPPRRRGGIPHSDRRKSRMACLSLTDRALKFWITALASDAGYPLLLTEVPAKMPSTSKLRPAEVRVDTE